MLGVQLITVVSILGLLSAISCENDLSPLYASCEIKPFSGVWGISGLIHLTHMQDSGLAWMNISLGGFNSSEFNKKHGFHIHMNGQISNQCGDSGNPFIPTWNPIFGVRNVFVDGSGNVITTLSSPVLVLSGPDSILNRSIVVHCDEDDLGLGNFSDSISAGHAGLRAGCCVIIPNSTTIQPMSFDAVSTQQPVKNTPVNSAIVLRSRLLRTNIIATTILCFEFNYLFQSIN